MCHCLKSTTLLTLALIVSLTACAPAATPVPPTATNPPLPTETPILPTATAKIAPTHTPALSPTVTPKSRLFKGTFDAGGVNLFIECLGDGSPTIVFDSGWGMDSNAWWNVIPKVLSQTRVCIYDRASMGQSDVQSGLRTSGQMVEQLHTLLGSAGIEGPYILVGHSLGGMNMLVFANRFPGEVAGVVLVDSAHPDQDDRSLAVLPTPAPDETKILTSLRDPTFSNPEDPGFPEPMNWDEILAQVRAVKSLGSIPLTVLVAVDPTRTYWRGEVSPDLAASLDKVWLDLHKEYTQLSTNSSLVLAEHSGHYIQNDEPQLVIDAILNLVDTARQK